MPDDYNITMRFIRPFTYSNLHRPNINSKTQTAIDRRTIKDHGMCFYLRIHFTISHFRFSRPCISLRNIVKWFEKLTILLHYYLAKLNGHFQFTIISISILLFQQRNAIHNRAGNNQFGAGKVLLESSRFSN